MTTKKPPVRKKTTRKAATEQDGVDSSIEKTEEVAEVKPKSTPRKKKAAAKKATAIIAPSIISAVTALSTKKGFTEIFKSGDESKRMPTPFMTLNAALGGGTMEGRIVEFYGTNHTGRTTITVQIAEYQMKPGDIALFFDFEQTFLPEHAKICTANRLNIIHLADLPKFLAIPGEQPPTMVWCQPITLEEGVETMVELVKIMGRMITHIIIDSIAAMTPSTVMESESGDANVAARARLLAPFWESRSKLFHQHHVSVFAINQERDKIGGNSGSGASWGAVQTYTVGGRATAYYASQRIKFSSGESTGWENVLPHGCHRAYLDIMKNKCKGTRRMKTALVLWPGRGFSPEIELIDLCAEKNVLKKITGGFTFIRPDGSESNMISKRNLLATMVKPGGDRLMNFLRDRLIEKLDGSPCIFKDYSPKEGLDFAQLLLCDEGFEVVDEETGETEEETDLTVIE